jgi:Permuted papain-like amidase enzyme, YaeF/YiiX, C92 family
MLLSTLVLWFIMTSQSGCHRQAADNANVSQKASKTEILREGDIVFQQSHSPQCEAIRAATGSSWTHVGIVFFKNNQWVVLEAVEPVCITPFEVWTKRSEHNEVKRLIKCDELLTPEAIKNMWEMGASWTNLHYDIGFSWSDEEMYCSELVYKLYERELGLAVGERKQLKEYDLSSPIVKKIMKQRYGSSIPYDEWMISPGAMYDSPLLILVD